MKKNNSVDVYNYIYREITAGRLPMGAPINEAEIAQKLEISRSPVREALKKLEGEGIVVHYAHRGTFVMTMTAQDIEELYDLRMALELFAAEKAIQYLDIDMLKSVERKFQVLDKNSPVSDYHEANQQLHTLLIRASGNRRLENMYRVLNSQINMLNILSTENPLDFVDSRQEHLDIIHSMQEKDLEKTKSNIREHIINRKNNTIKQFINNWNKVGGGKQYE